ncbi:hypothetical protein DY000_02057392 [Brassica cretica]|uniref:Uncharacterized protein n=1 Tax=Brassica cretica TaxID=69181 RepID=A0ABQ7AJV7_BRACR|nr:hypothetical protein DY000_02057392 [Brassica cretica]
MPRLGIDLILWRLAHFLSHLSRSPSFHGLSHLAHGYLMLGYCPVGSCGYLVLGYYPAGSCGYLVLGYYPAGSHILDSLGDSNTFIRRHPLSVLHNTLHTLKRNTDAKRHLIHLRSGSGTETREMRSEQIWNKGIGKRRDLVTTTNRLQPPPPPPLTAARREGERERRRGDREKRKTRKGERDDG